MCGIYLTNHSISENKFREKLKRIQFRGPDYQGYFRIKSVQLGHNRLSIIDLESRSNQPMQENEYTIIFNGEIYNYLDVKIQLEKEGVEFTTTSDTEVLLKGFIRKGHKILDLINGMFSFAIYNSKKNVVFIARDRLGVKPLYYSWQKGKLELCSQLSPLHSNGELDEEAITSYLETGYIPSPMSIYKDIKKFPPGKYAVCDLNNKSFKQFTYWDLQNVSIRKISYKKAKEDLHQLLKDAVKIRLQSDVPYGCFLSGGIDSALITSLAQDSLKSPVRTFTVGFDEKKFDESSIAYDYANHLGTDHRLENCSQENVLALIDDFFNVYDEPFADSSALPSLLINKTTKQNATVVLSGDGGDESFFGYNHFNWILLVKLIFNFPLFIRKIIQLIFPFKLFGKRGRSLKNIIGYNKIDEFIKHIFTGFESITINSNSSWFNNYKKYLSLTKNHLQKAADLNIRLWMENDSNTKVDRASMAYSVEVRSPFLDYRIIEFCRSLPVKYRFSMIRGRKRILKDILAEYIPRIFFDKPKKGFSVPMDKWIREELKSEILIYFSNSHISKIPCLNKNKIKLFLEKHLANKADYSSYIWRVYVLSKWMDINHKGK